MLALLVNLFGNIIGACSWIQQIVKIYRTHDVSGFDVRAYICSMLSNSIFMGYAFFTQEWFFMVFAMVNFSLCFIETCQIIIYTKKP